MKLRRWKSGVVCRVEAAHRNCINNETVFPLMQSDSHCVGDWSRPRSYANEGLMDVESGNEAFRGC